MVPKIGEKHFGDQSLLNWNFRGKWKALPGSLVRVVHSKLRTNFSRLLNLDYTMHMHESQAFSAPAVIHWLGEPKPWSRKSWMRVDADTRQMRASSKTSPHSTLWWQLCSDGLRDVPLALLSGIATG